jgi:hypothetical protein
MLGCPLPIRLHMRHLFQVRVLKRLLVFSIFLFLVAAIWIIGIRLKGPRIHLLPEELPHVVRHPPPLQAQFPPPQKGVNPGEEISRIHARGITGKHIGIAIVDRPLLTRHQDFADRLRWYDEIDTELDEPAGWHSTAVASIAVGRSTGVAPDADLYFVGVGMNWAHEPIGDWFVAARRALHYGQTLPLAIRWILELNRRLPVDRKIRALSISVDSGGTFTQAIDEARREGLFVSAFDLRLPRLVR